MAMFSMIFERQGEGSREANGLPHVCSRPFARNQHQVHATTWRGEPPPIGVALPAHLQARDTTVQPHALETYDQLKEKYDASSDIPPAED
jgi:hypothetical protein